MSEGRPTVAIVGAGPTGIACAVELTRRGVASVCYDKGSILDSIYHFPEEMTWFSTRDLLDIAGVPFASPHAHPTRLETLAYYRGVAEAWDVRVEPETEIVSARPKADGFRISARRSGVEIEMEAGAVVLATGFFHNPRQLGVEGENLPHVYQRYVSGFPFHGRDVLVIGGKNSAAEAALDLYRHGARVTMAVRGPAISERVKYWIKPDLENRIRAGAIAAIFQARVCGIEPDAVTLETPRGKTRVKAQAVFPLIGYQPDFGLMRRCGITLEGDSSVPVHDLNTLETDVPGVYLAGAVVAGRDTGRIFIENSRHHAVAVAQSIARRERFLHA